MGKSWFRGGVIVFAVTGCQVVSGAPPPSVQAADHAVAIPSATPPARHQVAPPAAPRQCLQKDLPHLPLEPVQSLTEGWRANLERLIQGTDISVSVAIGDRLLFEHQGTTPRTPASNEKLLLSMALLDEFQAGSRVDTTATGLLHGDVISGDVIVRSGGDPTFGDAGYRAVLGLGGSSIDRVARKIVARGVRRIEGGVVGLRGPLLGDWNAPGWMPYVPQRYIARPTALSYNGNASETPAPERQVALALTNRLEQLGVEVQDRPGTRVSRSPSDRTVAKVASPPLIEQIAVMDRDSSNFIAEVLSKRLGARCFGVPGTIAKGARALRAWARRQGARIVANDASGLSYDNRVTTNDLVGFLSRARQRPWGDRLLAALAGPGQGTLAGRLAGVQVRAKTGSLFDGTSGLSGYVWLDRVRSWASFSILSRLGGAARALEDEIVRFVASSATI